MANLTSVTLSSGVPVSGSGIVSTIDNMPNLVLTTQIGNTTNTVAIKGGSTSPVAGDPALVVAISPNSVNANGQTTMANSAPVVIASNQSAIATYANNVWYSGTSNNGLLTGVLSLQTTEMNSLSNTSVIVSSVGGSSGVFSNLSTAQATQGEVFFTFGSAVTSSLATGANLCGWFLQTYDGTHYETTTTAPPRSPDFVIPLPTATVSSSSVYKAGSFVSIPALNFYTMVQNNSGQPLPSSGNVLRTAFVTQQY